MPNWLTPLESFIAKQLAPLNRKLDSILSTQAEESAAIAANATTTQQILTIAQNLGTLVPQYIADVNAYLAKNAAGGLSQTELDTDNASLATQGQQLTEALQALTGIAPAVTTADATVNPPAATPAPAETTTASEPAAATEAVPAA